MCMYDSYQTTLYKIAPGACLKSYGMNVARIVGISESVIQRASEMAAQFEKMAWNAVDR